MTSDPFFTVIMATWGRGRHILPSIQSVLGQRFRSFELIVVGDACTDETEAIVAGLADTRLRWINLATRCGSQSAPNNAGIVAARGEVIAYLGHDDIWEPTHLQELARLFRSDDPPDFGVSGTINHLPNGIPGSRVQGLFTDDAAKHKYFFPPSCLAHRKDVTDRIGPWRMPMEIRAPVDEDLLLRAASADLRFRSTGVVTVHKFASAARYLSYVQQRSDEQAAMLAEMEAPDHAEAVAAAVETAKRQGNFMAAFRRAYDHLAPGELARLNAARRGLLRPKLQPLGKGAVIRQKREPCALDWRERPLLGIRLHRLNPRPRFLLPYSSGKAVLTMRVVHSDRAAIGPLLLLCNDQSVTAVPVGLRRSLWGWTARYEATVHLRPDQPSVLEFHLSPEQRRQTRVGSLRLGFGIGRLRLRPITGP